MRAMAALALLVFAAPAAAQEIDLKPGQILQFGAGISSCATWLQSPASENNGTSWILGYWTGMNEQGADNQRGTGNSTDIPGLVAEIKKACADQPSMSLREATAKTYWDFVAKNK